MRIHLHDFSGHPFQAQLSRRLAARGHPVTHTWCEQYLGGRGRLARQPGDASGLAFRAVATDVPFERYAPVGRLRFERAYGATLGRALGTERPDVAVLCNIPLFAHAQVARQLGRAGVPWVFWHQDVYSAGIAAEAARKLPSQVARRVADYATKVERDLTHDAAAVVAIGSPFLQRYREWDLDLSRVSVIPNWAPLDEITPQPRDNGWWPLASGGRRLLYAGTLGRKHNPQLLLDLVDAVRARGVATSLTVASEGAGADDLRAATGDRPDIAFTGFQPADTFPRMLGSADVLVALLEPDAAGFSIPSKVLSYLSAGRPVLVLAPGGNPCAADVRAAGGMVCDPTPDGVAAAARWIAGLSDADVRELGADARAVACRLFDVETITDRFLAVLADAADPRQRVARLRVAA